ncbi:LuxR C-terminal-related transcriptional regulator [Nocardioides sp. HB32]
MASSTFLTFGIDSRSAHLMLDTADTCVALLLTYLLWGRFRRTRRLQDLLLAQGFLLLAASGGVLLLVHLAAGVERPGRWDVWSAVAVRVAAAGLVLAAAAVGRDRLVASGVRLVVAGPFVVLGPVLAGLVVLREHLPGALPIASPAGATHPDIIGPTALLVAQAAGAVAFGVSSILFARQAARRHDALVLWLGPACALGAFARVNYVLFPSLFTDWLYPGDVLRTASYAVLREIGEHWPGWASAVVLEDRRRLPRELHDGVVQELGLIRRTTLGDVPAGAVREELSPPATVPSTRHARRSTPSAAVPLNRWVRVAPPVSPRMVMRIMDEFRAAPERRFGRRSPAAARLSPREWEIMNLLAAGRTTEETAAELFLSPTTVRVHVSTVLKKLRVKDRESALRVLRGE